MCTVVILRRPGDKWPVVVGANRDEKVDRPWEAPGRHWPDRENVVAGIDLLAKGSWMGLNDEGVIACVLNRHNSLGPDPTRRSRGEIVLEALDHVDACEAAESLASLEGRNYRPFNLVVADNRDAFWLKNDTYENKGVVEIRKIPEGLSIITSHDLNDARSGRIAFYAPLFMAACPPDIENGDWSNWKQLMASRKFKKGMHPGEAMLIVSDTGFGTVSSSLLALPSIESRATKPVWLFSNGPPDQSSYEQIVF